ncbi:MAG: ADOP family duplicated permease [Gemmatimonadaceae bacterium]
MELLGRIGRRVRSLLHRPRAERELEAELRFHLEMEMEKHVRAGLTPGEARRAALVVFGGVERVKEECRDARGTRPVEKLAQDLRYAARRLRKQPGFSVPAILTLGLGVGVTGAIFALVHGVLLRPLPYPASDRLVLVRHTAPGAGMAVAGQSGTTYLHYRANSRVFEEIGVYFDRELTLSDRDDPERIQAANSTPSIFWALGAKPLHGRLFTQADADGSPARGAVLLSYGLWVRRYGADPGIVGRSVELNRGHSRVVGVMGPDFAFPDPATQLWYAMPIRSKAAPTLQSLFMTSVARLRPGVSAREAELDAQRLVGTLADVYPEVRAELLRDAQLRAVVVPLKDAMVADVRPALVLLLLTASFVLLVALANVANLFLARSARLRWEVAVQRALGASSGDVARRFLSEAALVAALGGVLAGAVAYAGVESRFGFEPGQIPRLHEVRVDWIVLAFTFGLSLVTGLVLGAVSLASAGRPHVPTALKGAADRVTASRRTQTAQRLLVAVQVALALTLLIGSATMVQSFWRLRRAELGFNPKQLLALDVALPVRAYPDYHENAAFFEQLLARVRAVPGVAAAEAVGVAPLTAAPSFLGEPVVAEVWARGTPTAPLPAGVNMATPGYFAAMEIPIARGRAFRPGDLASDARPVLLSAELARALFAEHDPVGRRVKLPDRRELTAFTVVGVAADVPGTSIVSGPARTVYFPALNDARADSTDTHALPVWPREMTVVVRASLPPSSLVASVRGIIKELDPKVPVARVRTMQEVVTASMARARLTMLLLLTAAGCALTLGVIGIYSVVAYTVSRRIPELGLRIALGATPSDVHRLVVRQGVLVTLAGIAAGLVAAASLIGFLRGLLFEVSPRDPASFATMSLLLFAIATAASYLPARRAARVDPIAALRAE